MGPENSEMKGITREQNEFIWRSEGIMLMDCLSVCLGGDCVISRICIKFDSMFMYAYVSRYMTAFTLMYFVTFSLRLVVNVSVVVYELFCTVFLCCFCACHLPSELNLL